MDFGLLYIVTLIIHAKVTMKINYWKTIKDLGFRYEAPIFFLKKPYYYSLFQTVVAIFAVAFAFQVSEVNGLEYKYIMIVFLCVSWLFCRMIGCYDALHRYRSILHSLMNRSKSEKEKSFYQNKLNKSNRELLKEEKRITKMQTGSLFQ